MHPGKCVGYRNIGLAAPCAACSACDAAVRLASWPCLSAALHDHCDVNVDDCKVCPSGQDTHSEKGDGLAAVAKSWEC